MTMTMQSPLEDEDLLREIFLRLPPMASTLSRASLVCTRWRRILSDPRFLGRLRRRHPKPPLLGFFKGSILQHRVFTPILDPNWPDCIPTEPESPVFRFFIKFLRRFTQPPVLGFWKQFLRRFTTRRRRPPISKFLKGFRLTYPAFTPVLDPLNRIPAERFYVPDHPGPGTGNWQFQGCRHGLAVTISDSLSEVFVWDPLNGQQHRVPFPPDICNAQRESFCRCSATVVCADDQDGHVHDDGFVTPSFNLVLVCTSRLSKTSLACVYESVSGVWGNIASAATTGTIVKLRPGILIRNSVYWLLYEGEILAFDIERQTLAVIKTPADAHFTDAFSFQLLRTDDDSVLGFAVMSELGIHLWERRLNSDGVAGWVLQQKINQLEGIMPNEFSNAAMVGYDEELNVVVLSTYSGNFMLHLKSMRIRLISKGNKRDNTIHFPYRNFYTAGRGVGWKWVDPNLKTQEIC